MAAYVSLAVDAGVNGLNKKRIDVDGVNRA